MHRVKMECSYHTGHQCTSILPQYLLIFPFHYTLRSEDKNLSKKFVFTARQMSDGPQVAVLLTQIMDTFQPAALIFAKALTSVMGSSAQTHNQLVQWITLSLSSIRLIFKSDHVSSSDITKAQH